MAIFGDLEQLAFGDLAKVLRPQTGILFMNRALHGRSVELHLQDGILRALFIDGFPVREEGRLHDALNQIVAYGRGPFEFDAVPHDDLTHDLAVPLDEVLHRDVVVQAPEEAFLPHPDTRFGLGSRGAPVPQPLRGIWRQLQPHLVAGVSAREIAARLGQPEQMARTLLYQLRNADLIAPLRATATRSKRPAPTLGAMQRFLGALRLDTAQVSDARDDEDGQPPRTEAAKTPAGRTSR